MALCCVVQRENRKRLKIHALIIINNKNSWYLKQNIVLKQNIKEKVKERKGKVLNNIVAAIKK